MWNYIETSTFNVNGNSLPGPLIIGTFDKRAAGEVKLQDSFASMPAQAGDMEDEVDDFFIKARN